MSKQNRTENGTDRLQDIRARLDARHEDGYDHFTAADIACLLAEVDRLHRYVVHKHNDCWQTGSCVCGLWA